jgi:hypothetical protein
MPVNRVTVLFVSSMLGRIQMQVKALSELVKRLEQNAS